MFLLGGSYVKKIVIFLLLIKQWKVLMLFA